MSFKSLEQRFNEKVNALYAGAKTKFDNGRPSTGANDDPLIVRKPGDGYFTIADKIGGRSLPINSTIQDVKRLTLFTLSVRGIAFLAKQQLLQTGNTFEQTRLINPAFVVGNGVPFLHLRRHLRPITGGPGGPLIGKTDTSYANVRKIGQLQKTTYNSFTENAGGGIGNFFKKLAGPITSTISAVTAKKNVGEDFGYDGKGWEQTRPELGREDKDYIVGFNAPAFRFGGRIQTQTFSGQLYGAIPNGVGNWNGEYTTYINLTNEAKKWGPRTWRRHFPFNISPYQDIILSEPADSRSIKTKYETFEFEESVISDTMPDVDLGTSIPDILDTVRVEYGVTNRSRWYDLNANGQGQPMPYLKYFVADPESISDGAQFDPTNLRSTNARDLAQNRTDTTKKISYIKDPSNFTVNTGQRVLEPYKYINGATDGFEDAITVSFAMANDESIKFRAFITDLSENVTPTYNALQYIGRIEKFINYTGVQREASFKLSILAFSEEELDGVWRRINYLTGLAFPYGFTRGILQPNILRLTIGQVYVNQPGYISSLNKSFKEVTETWDLDREVPIGATMDMRFTIIEKKTKIAESPFYGITETMQGFSDSLRIPDTVQQASQDSTNSAPTNEPLTTDVTQRNTSNPPLFNVPPGFRQNENVITNPFAITGSVSSPRPIRTPVSNRPFTGFGGGGGFAGGGGGSTW